MSKRKGYARNFPVKKATVSRKCLNPSATKIPNATIMNVADAAKVFEDLFFSLGGWPPAAEVAVALFLNAQNNLLNYYSITGTVDHAAVYPREIVAAALDCAATSVILAHNHPSGQPEPSSQDVDLTRKVKTALATVDIRLHDHLVLGFDTIHMTMTAVSMAERGLM